MWLDRIFHRQNHLPMLKLFWVCIHSAYEVSIWVKLSGPIQQPDTVPDAIAVRGTATFLSAGSMSKPLSRAAMQKYGNYCPTICRKKSGGHTITRIVEKLQLKYAPLTATRKKAGDRVGYGHCDSRCPFHVKQSERMQTIKDYFGGMRQARVERRRTARS